MKLVIRADDVGYSEAVNYGISKSVHDGLVRSVGLMPNMPAAKHGLELLSDVKVCIGQHTNVCLGKPCADPALIPSLLDENGDLKSSKLYRAAWKEGREFVVLDEMVLEIEAQYHRFKELVGHEPGYFEAHAVMNKNLFKALEIVAARHHLRYSAMVPGDKTSTFDGKPIAVCGMDSMEPDYDPFECLKKGVAQGSPDLPNIFICHPGYLDDFILRSSSLTVNRTKEVAMLTDPAVKQWLDSRGVEVITYDDI